eukprot:COSAG02_NODE_22316_length_756_cov_1.404871_2_plen_106_part_00
MLLTSLLALAAATLAVAEETSGSGPVIPPPPSPPPPPPIKPAPAGAKNVLVIVCDDFRPFVADWTHRYGSRAPNLEKLASESMVFNNTYVQQAVCGPSRTYSAQH